MSDAPVHRMRVTFATDDTVKYVGHLDMHRAWERAIRRARLPMAYTQGFNPQARLHFAAALPVGFTGLAELVDVFLTEIMEPADFLSRLAAALPAGVHLLHAELAPRELPSLQSQVCGASYRVEVETAETGEAFLSRLDAFMARPEAWRARRKGKEMARYDLRPLVQALSWVGPTDYGHVFDVTMRAEPGATGRPDELLAELGLESAARRIVRLLLVFA